MDCPACSCLAAFGSVGVFPCTGGSHTALLDLNGEQSFQSEDVLAEDQFAGGHRIRLLKSIPPNVEQSASYTDLTRQFDYVAAGVHSLNGLFFEFGAVPLSSSSVPLCGSFPAKCATSFCLALGVHSIEGKAWVFGVSERVQML